MRTLFVTWDGPQVTYLEGLFLPIFRGLQACGIETDVLQFRWGTDAQGSSLRAVCEKAGCRYRQVRVLRRAGAVGPFVTAVLGSRDLTKAIRDFDSDVIMPRSLMPALTTLSATGLEIPILFDSDGLAADEKVEFGGLSRISPVYRAFRLIESAMVRRASTVLVRTERAAQVLAERSRVNLSHFRTVVNGRDENLFTPLNERDRAVVRRELNVPAGEPMLVYAGSVGPQYRFDLIKSFMLALTERCPEARLLVLTGQPGEAQRLLGTELSGSTIVRSVPPLDVPRYLAAADAGFAFRATSFSTMAIAPIKLGEYLLCGVPVIGTEEVGDTGPAVAAGVFCDQSAGPAAAADWIMNSVLADRGRLREISRTVGLGCFSLRRSVADYGEALRHVSRPSEDN